MFYWVFIWLRKVLPSFTGFHWYSSDFTKHYLVLPSSMGFSQVLMDFNGLYWVFTRFH